MLALTMPMTSSDNPALTRHLRWWFGDLAYRLLSQTFINVAGAIAV
jgi:hypothetical protein